MARVHSSGSRAGHVAPVNDLGAVGTLAITSAYLVDRTQVNDVVNNAFIILLTRLFSNIEQ